MIVSLNVGRYGFSFHELFTNPKALQVFYQIRLPRILFCILAGGALSLAGYVFQSLFQNPLVSGDVLGVSQGCSVGAILAMLIGVNGLGLQLFSFAGGFLAMGICMMMAHQWKGNHLLHLILVGIMVGALCNSLIMILKLSADPYEMLPAIEFWLMGSLSSIKWSDIGLASLSIVVATFFLFLLRYQIYLLSHGEEEAFTLGVNVSKVRLIVIVCATLLVSSVISCVGIISWIGLMSPHIVRLMTKQNFHETVLESFLIGSSLLLCADTFSRTLFTFELPISILTSMMGAVFLYLVLSKKRIRL